LLIAEDANINLYIFAHSRVELIYEMNGKIIIMWDKYAKADS